ncbi:hypothetical protein Q5Y75_05810 [Ruegeria sp. 2205SS24-7]|uniref:hypothetical protein n=1 Tax=Ruegeria discodermiae TaxID=3064389 RepID=UPI00274089F9|nr:hypothetical protein [Ruegeria sp. 2205SS24-7]MDP5216727.1 hypothetical protein [Ruegeria sp. 2205SS24-7]
MKVQDMPSRVREACKERGRMDDENLTPLVAMREWSGWHLGDPYWADTIINLYEEMKDQT